MAENNANLEAQPEEFEVEVQEDAASQDDELESYTKSVSKRINKLNQRNRETEERATRAEQVAAQRETEIAALRNHTVNLGQNLFQKEEESVQSKEVQADELYRRAVESGDAELMSKADSLKSDVAISKEKINAAKQQQVQYQQQQQQQQQYAQQMPQQPMQQGDQEVQPTQQAMGWYEKNKWYGDAENSDNLQATQFAYFTHYNLINEGYEADSNEYYDELNNRVFKVYPHLQGAAGNDERPAVQRVASASVGSRQKTQGKKSGVIFTKGEVDRLRGLKPYNMSDEDWLKMVAKEKQKISQREVG
tara:strand:- start:276 stop:1193 length:918 start_codon:yes stop_codon:yes gene_type:complete